MGERNIKNKKVYKKGKIPLFYKHNDEKILNMIKIMQNCSVGTTCLVYIIVLLLLFRKQLVLSILFFIREGNLLIIVNEKQLYFAKFKLF